ncbi:MAG: iron-containing alcohol dehydrogenase [Bacteroidota bacterium]
MENFTYYNPTKLHFGKDATEKLGKAASAYGQKAILIYGKGSIKTNGIYDAVTEQLKQHHIDFIEHSGIKSNPLVEDVDAAVEKAREFKADMVIAVGGGSVVDSSKTIAITAPSSHQAWDFYSRKAKPKKALPLLAVLTLAATGTEMNPLAVLQNHQSGQKTSFAHPLMYPAHSFLDPQNTITVNREYTAYGIADLTAHALEAWFGKGDASLSDRIVISIIKEAMDYGPELLNDLNNYELRAKIMYAATLALNGLTQNGRISGDWGVHALGHEMSLLFDIPHGASLTVAYPAWLKFHKKSAEQRIILLGRKLFGVHTADETIEHLEYFFETLGVPTRLKDINLNKKDKQQTLIASMNKNKAQGMHHSLSDDDRATIVALMDAEKPKSTY